MTNRNPGVDAVLEALAVFRATKLMQQDDLPPLPELREKLMARYGASRWSALLDCPWCLSVWLGLASVGLRHLAPRFWRVGASVLASSAVAGVISEWLASVEPDLDSMVKHYRYEESPAQRPPVADPGVWPGSPSGAEMEAGRMRSRLPDA